MSGIARVSRWSLFQVYGRDRRGHGESCPPARMGYPLVGASSCLALCNCGNVRFIEPKLVRDPLCRIDCTQIMCSDIPSRPQKELKLERIAKNIVASPGLGLRLGLLKTQAQPKFTSSCHQGLALAGLERALLGRSKPSPVHHRGQTAYRATLGLTMIATTLTT
jgi:hypothetical protein